MTTLHRFPITASEIDRVVRVFYQRVRDDAVLGPIFATHVSDWPSHEVKIADFWRNAILGERRYDGNPMQVHMTAGNVKPGHFDVWLPHFDAVLSQELGEQTAMQWSHLAHRIGRGLRFGLMQAGAVPVLR